jgi:putative Holliday junction resolvase
VRILGIDVGRRRIGLAISDATRTLARPLATLTVGTDDAVEKVLKEVSRLSAEEDGLSGIVVGVPARLDGTPSDQTPYVLAFIETLKKSTTLPIAGEGEHLTSREAESRLAVRDRDWRRRKQTLDAAAAAVILQDYLDRRSSTGSHS